MRRCRKEAHRRGHAMEESAVNVDRGVLVSTMRRLAILGGEAIMEIYRRDDLVIRKKQDSSPVTEADEAADRLIAAGLTAGFPGLAPGNRGTVRDP